MHAWLGSTGVKKYTCGCPDVIDAWHLETYSFSTSYLRSIGNKGNS